MASNVAPDSWETQADSASGDCVDPNDVSAKFSTLNVNAAEFVPSFSFVSPQTESSSETPSMDNSTAEQPVTNGKDKETFY